MSNPNDRIVLTRSNLQALIDEIKAEISAPAVDTVYPVGALYWTSKAPNNGGNPNTLFPGTTWQRLTGAFIWAASDSDTVTPATSGSAKTADGGSNTRTIEKSNLPPHAHSFTPSGKISSDNSTLNNKTGAMSEHSSGSLVFNIDNNNRAIVGYGGTIFSKTTQASPFNQKLAVTANVPDEGTLINVNIAHTHPAYFKGTAGNTGDGGFAKTALNIKNPYINRYCWERTA